MDAHESLHLREFFKNRLGAGLQSSPSCALSKRRKKPPLRTPSDAVPCACTRAALSPAVRARVAGRGAVSGGERGCQRLVRGAARAQGGAQAARRRTLRGGESRSTMRREPSRWCVVTGRAAEVTNAGAPLSGPVEGEA